MVKIGFIGLGRMGENMVLNLLDHKIQVVGFNRSPKPTKKLSKKKGFTASYDINELVSKLPKKKIIWLMVPAGKPVDDLLKNLTPLLKKGDIIIDGGNSFFKDSQSRSKVLEKKGIHYLDCGTSGGMEGARKGACMMVGGNKRAFKQTEILYKNMCVPKGYSYFGKSGGGHFIKMVHNGIEYGMMSAIGEGMETIRKFSKDFKYNEKEAVKVYAHGSIIESRLMSWLWDAYNIPGYLNSISCEVPTGETEKEMKALEKMAAMPVLNAARNFRVLSRSKKVCGQLVAAMRNQFGGHAVKKK